MDLQVGDIIRMKKPHPCGSKEWRILRVGADIRLECLGCGHLLMLPRAKLEKNMRKEILRVRSIENRNST